MLKEITWDELQVGDVFAEDMSKVVEIKDWVYKPCFRLVNEYEQDLIVSEDHLISVRTNEEFVNSKASKDLVGERSINWGTAKDIYDRYGDKEITTLDGDKFRIEPYDNGELKRCRCITTDSGTYMINGFLNHNSSRGTHTLDSMKEIVANLIDSGMSEDWIARNLYLEKEAIMRYKQLSGLASAFRDANDFSKDVWDPIKDRSEERKANVKLVRQARAYVRTWRKLANEEGGDFDVPIDLDIIAAAKNLGFDEANPFIMPIKVDTETGKVIETGLVGVSEPDENEEE